MQENILIMMPFTEAYQAQTIEIAGGNTVCFVGEGKPDAEQLRKATVIIGNPSAQELALCENLRWLQLRTAGTDMYTKDGVLPPGVVLTSASGGYGTAISEYLLAVTFSLCKQLHRYRDQQHAQVWSPVSDIRTVAGATVLVIGTGDIGTQYARKMQALGAHVYGVRRKTGEASPYFESMGTLDDLDTLLPLADIVALCLPANAQTAGLMDAAHLAMMKHGTLLLNIGRGVLVDTDALMAALDAGQVGGAALDVTDPEPLPAGHSLWSYKNVIITPHSAGGEYYGVIYGDTIAVCLDNLQRYLTGEPLKNVAQQPSA